MLKYLVGDENFDQIMQTYFRRYRFKHPHTEDFMAVAEEVSGQDLKWFFSQWLETTKTCDYAITELKSQQVGDLFKTEVEVERKGDAVMPIEVCLQAKGGEKALKSWDGKGKRTKISFQTKSKPKWAQIDPEWKILETNCWNNRKPRKVTLHPIFDFPDFEEYQLFYGPSFWFDGVDGATPGLWLQGRQFVDSGPLKGKNQWLLGTSWGIRSHTLNWKVSYHTPIPLGGRWSRINLQANHSHGRLFSSLCLDWHLSPHLLFGPAHKIGLRGEYLDVQDLDNVYEGDWSPGKVIGPVIDYSYSFPGIHFSSRYSLSLKSGQKVWGGEYHFNRGSLELRNRFRWRRGLRAGLRFFTGYVGGSPPNQEMFFISGGTALTTRTWDNMGGEGETLPPGTPLCQRGWKPEGILWSASEGKGHLGHQPLHPLPSYTPFSFYNVGNVGAKLSLKSPSKREESRLPLAGGFKPPHPSTILSV